MSDREIVITRTLNAPARVVFEAWTRPELVSRWWAPKSLRVSAVSFTADVRVGGRYRYVLRRHTGGEFAFLGKYTEITPYSRLVYTSMFEQKGVASADEAGAAIVTVTFEEHEGKTDLVARELYPSKEVLDGVLASGMEHGMRVTMDQLDELVASFQASEGLWLEK